MTLNIKKALVTGGAGFIGSHLVDALLSDGIDVIVIDNLSTGHLKNIEHVRNRITFYEADIRSFDFLSKISKGCDVIFHLAAMVSVPQTVEEPVESAMVNEIGTLYILETARKNRVNRVVLSSSCAVYGDDPNLPKREHMMPRPQTPYAIQKLTGEQYACLYHTLYGVETVCLRYFNVYGPRQHPSSPYSGVISIFLAKAVDGLIPIIYGDGTQYRDFVFVHDVVKANLLAAASDHASGLVLNIGTGRYLRINELWEMIIQMTHKDIKPTYHPPRPGDIRESVANIDLMRETLSFEPQYPYEKGLAITFEWFQRVREKTVNKGCEFPILP